VRAGVFPALIMTMAAAMALTAAAAETPSPGDVEQGVIDAANDFRADNGLGRLAENHVLSSDARAFAAYMARTDRFSHTADGRDAGGRAQAVGYDYCDLSENIAVEEGYPAERLARQFMTGWENSPGHRRNLLDSRVTETGVGVARAPGSIRRYFAVQVFGRPGAARYSFRVENQSNQTVGFTFEGEHHRLEPLSGLTHTTCAAGDLVFDSDTATGHLNYAVTPGATFVLSSPYKDVQIEVQRPAPPRGRPKED